MKRSITITHLLFTRHPPMLRGSSTHQASTIHHLLLAIPPLSADSVRSVCLSIECPHRPLSIYQSSLVICLSLNQLLLTSMYPPFTVFRLPASPTTMLPGLPAIISTPVRITHTPPTTASTFPLIHLSIQPSSPTNCAFTWYLTWPSRSLHSSTAPVSVCINNSGPVSLLYRPPPSFSHSPTRLLTILSPIHP